MPTTHLLKKDTICHACDKLVYANSRYVCINNTYTYHTSCTKCSVCDCCLDLLNYKTDSTGIKLYCSMHYGTAGRIYGMAPYI